MPAHKLLCPAPTTEACYGNQSSYTTYYAVLFPEAERVPRWITFKALSPAFPYNQWQYETPSHPAKHIIGNVGLHITITGNGLRARSRTSSPIKVYYRAKSPGDGLSLNISVLSATNQRAAQSWFGPLLAVKAFPPFASPSEKLDKKALLPQYLDMTLVDFRDVIDLLCTYPSFDINDMTLDVAAPRLEVSAVRINSSSDQALGRPRFELLQIRADDTACHAPVTAISQLIQFPVRVSRCGPPYAAGYDAAAHYVDNLAATYLQLGVDPETNWGFVGREWVDPAGSVLVVRENAEELLQQHVEALAHWCAYVLRPLFLDSMGMGAEPESPMSKELVLSRVNKREWGCFYRGFDEWKGAVDKGWKKGIWPC